MTKLQELGEKLAAKRGVASQVFKEAGEDLDFSKVTSLDGATPEEKIEKLTVLRTEIDSIASEHQKMLSLSNVRDDNDRELKELNAPGPRLQRTTDGARAKTIGELFTEAVAYQNEKGHHSQNSRYGVDIPHVDLKTTMTEAAGFAPPNYRSNIVIPSAQPRAVIQDFIPSSLTSNSSVKYMEETTFTNNVASTAQGSAGGEVALAYTERSSVVETITGFLPVTEQQLEDVMGIQAMISERLLLMYQLKEQGQIISGNGSSPQLDGFLHRSGVQNQPKGSDSTPDAILKAVTLVRFTGYAEPSAIGMHPDNWQAVRLLKDSIGNYLWGNPATPGPQVIWGLPVFTNTAITSGTALLGDFQMYSHLSRNLGVRIDVGLNGTDFTKNQLTVRVTGRTSLEIYRNAAFCTVTSL